MALTVGLSALLRLGDFFFFQKERERENKNKTAIICSWGNLADTAIFQFRTKNWNGGYHTNDRLRTAVEIPPGAPLRLLWETHFQKPKEFECSSLVFLVRVVRLCVVL